MCRLRSQTIPASVSLSRSSVVRLQLLSRRMELTSIPSISCASTKSWLRCITRRLLDYAVSIRLSQVFRLVVALIFGQILRGCVRVRGGPWIFYSGQTFDTSLFLAQTMLLSSWRLEQQLRGLMRDVLSRRSMRSNHAP